MKNRAVRIIIAGTRDFDDYELLKFKVDRIVEKEFKNCYISIVSGTCKGADQLGESYARTKGYHLYKFPAEWDKYGRKAGPLRNEKMAKFASGELIDNECVGVLIAFWDGKSRGTKNMIENAHKYNLKVFTIIYSR